MNSVLHIAWQRAMPMLAVGIAIVGASLWWPYTIDDSYIILQYAHNIAHGSGPVFNLGERTEGYSCPLQVFLLASLQRAGANPLLAIKMLGILCAMALVLLLYVALDRAGCDSSVAGAASLWLALTPGLLLYAPSGMETVPFALAVAFAAFIPAIASSEHTRALLLPVALLLVATLRPEGLLVVACLSVIWIALGGSHRVTASIVIAWVILIALAILRYRYYGTLLPNTYLAKPSPVAHALASGAWAQAATLLADSVQETALPVLDRAGGIGLLAAASIAFAMRRELATYSALAACVAGLVFLLYAPHDWMLAHRFAIPFLAPLVFLAARGTSVMRAGLPASQLRVFRVALVITLVVGTSLQIAGTVSLRRFYHDGLENEALDGRYYVPIGAWLRQNSNPEDRILAYEVGAIGYVSGRTIVDHEGLICRDVAQIIHGAGGYESIRQGFDREGMAAVVRYCVGRRPQWFLLRSYVDVPLEIGRPAPVGIADEPIQNALLEALGDSIVVRKVFPMSPASTHPHTRDRYVVLGPHP